MGHEFSGTILEVHPEVPEASSFKIGQKCAVQPTIYCQSCGACRNGVENACANGGFIGLSGKFGRDVRGVRRMDEGKKMLMCGNNRWWWWVE
jgi:threonine dehydrogenase-like Zn-dependent dehydrogenase